MKGKERAEEHLGLLDWPDVSVQNGKEYDQSEVHNNASCMASSSCVRFGASLV